ncbi:MAG: 2-C-methyl-D-erythritol 4-phosphate cytidylyltransferase, partial [Rhizobiaceae bacterium]|nr:2-C-methyl-D-erythritol 4-phosphate cytidylyltransferase [Rhizobiaceae bacterium]
MTEKTEIAVVIVAAGRGERAGQSKEGPKQYRTIGGQPVMRRTVAAFAAAPGIGRIVIAIHRDDAALFNEAIG